MNLSGERAILAGWSRLGVMFNIVPSRNTPDLERLLIETARHIPSNPRLFVMTATWMEKYSRLIARHRLSRMVGELSDFNVTAVLGLLIDTIGRSGRELNVVKSLCHRADKPMPLFTVDRGSGMADFVRRHSSRLSRKWNLWAEEMELKSDAIRPGEWIMQTNPSMRTRAIFGGNLRASAIAGLQYDAPNGASEAALARLCNVTRKAMHEAIDHLQFCDMVCRVRTGRDYQITLNRRVFRNAG